MILRFGYACCICNLSVQLMVSVLLLTLCTFVSLVEKVRGIGSKGNCPVSTSSLFLPSHFPERSRAACLGPRQAAGEVQELGMVRCDGFGSR